MDDAETLHRRARLRELIDRRFDGKDVLLLDYIEQRTGKRPNQGEMSAIKKDHGPKSFGDKKAKTLCEQIGLDRFWFSKPIGSDLLPSSNFQTASDAAESFASSPQRGALPDGNAAPHFARSLNFIPIYRMEAFMHQQISDADRIGETEVPGQIGPKAFAVRVEDDTMSQASPSISKGMLVVFDPDIPARHMAIVLAAEPGSQPAIRQAIFDGHDLYLSAPQSGLPPRKVDITAIRGVAVKAVIDLS